MKIKDVKPFEAFSKDGNIYLRTEDGKAILLHDERGWIYTIGNHIEIPENAAFDVDVVGKLSFDITERTVMAKILALFADEDGWYEFRKHMTAVIGEAALATWFAPLWKDCDHRVEGHFFAFVDCMYGTTVLLHPDLIKWRNDVIRMTAQTGLHAHEYTPQFITTTHSDLLIEDFKRRRDKYLKELSTQVN